MKVKDIITLASDFCHEDELASSLRAEGGTLSTDGQAKADSLVRCFNLVYEEVSSSYLPIVKIEKVQTSDGKVMFSSLSQKVVDVIEVRNGHGRKIKFRKFDSYIFALADTVEVYYKTLPATLALTGEFSSLLPERVFAYGVAREYFYLTGMDDEAEIYDNRFKDSLLVLLGKNKEVVMPARGWI